MMNNLPIHLPIYFSNLGDAKQPFGLEGLIRGEEKPANSKVSVNSQALHLLACCDSVESRIRGEAADRAQVLESSVLMGAEMAFSQVAQQSSN
jgi:glucose-6-phosphate dehydrogenase assembly protein OpcA